MSPRLSQPPAHPGNTWMWYLAVRTKDKVDKLRNLRTSIFFARKRKTGQERKKKLTILVRVRNAKDLRLWAEGERNICACLCACVCACVCSNMRLDTCVYFLTLSLFPKSPWKQWPQGYEPTRCPGMHFDSESTKRAWLLLEQGQIMWVFMRSLFSWWQQWWLWVYSMHWGWS